MNNTPDILKKIIARKREEIAERSGRVSLHQLQSEIDDIPPTRGFLQALIAKQEAGLPAVIAEIKKASPSRGVLRPNFYPVEIAKTYAANGAACLSVLTDVDFFQGADEYLVQARTACELPVLRKDFMLDTWQVYESRKLGADCILLIVAALEDSEIRDLYGLARNLGMDVLVEIHDADELARVQDMRLPMIGINNRDLRTFATSLQTTVNLLPGIPSSCIVITESGIHTRDDVDFMLKHKVNAFLVGEAFMRENDPGAALGELFFEKF